MPKFKFFKIYFAYKIVLCVIRVFLLVSAGVYAQIIKMFLLVRVEVRRHCGHQSLPSTLSEDSGHLLWLHFPSPCRDPGVAGMRYCGWPLHVLWGLNSGTHACGTVIYLLNYLLSPMDFFSWEIF